MLFIYFYLYLLYIFIYIYINVLMFYLYTYRLNSPIAEDISPETYKYIIVFVSRTVEGETQFENTLCRESATALQRCKARSIAHSLPLRMPVPALCPVQPMCLQPISTSGGWGLSGRRVLPSRRPGDNESEVG